MTFIRVTHHRTFLYCYGRQFRSLSLFSRHILPCFVFLYHKTHFLLNKIPTRAQKNPSPLFSFPLLPAKVVAPRALNLLLVAFIAESSGSMRTGWWLGFCRCLEVQPAASSEQDKRFAQVPLLVLWKLPYVTNVDIVIKANIKMAVSWHRLTVA